MSSLGLAGLLGEYGSSDDESCDEFMTVTGSGPETLREVHLAPGLVDDIEEQVEQASRPQNRLELAYAKSRLPHPQCMCFDCFPTYLYLLHVRGNRICDNEASHSSCLVSPCPCWQRQAR